MGPRLPESALAFLAVFAGAAAGVELEADDADEAGEGDEGGDGRGEEVVVEGDEGPGDEAGAAADEEEQELEGADAGAVVHARLIPCAAVLVLLPPSEGKRAPEAGAPLDVGALAYAGVLTAAREKALDALVKLASGRQRNRALDLLGLTPGLAGELERDAALRSAPAAAAGEVYTGVLYQHLDLASLSDAAVARARERVLVASALWGVVALDDRIPAYRLSIAARLPALTKSGLAAYWRAPLAAALPDEPGALVVDMRSGGYAAAWRPKHATLVEVKASTADGRPISHMAKATRGTVTRELLQARRPAATPEDVAAAAGRGEGVGRVELHAPAKPGGAHVVNVVAAE
jgi:uncharacterized protein